MDREIIIETITKLFVGVDERNWEKVSNTLSSLVLLDYTSMFGADAVKLTPEEIVESWQTVLPGFDSTHHQLGNFLITNEPEKAHVFCYGTATHYLSNESLNDIWTVVGSYDFDLKKESGSWRIITMKFNFKYMDGNQDLPKMAQNRLKTQMV